MALQNMYTWVKNAKGRRQSKGKERAGEDVKALLPPIPTESPDEDRHNMTGFQLFCKENPEKHGTEPPPQLQLDDGTPRYDIGGWRTRRTADWKAIGEERQAMYNQRAAAEKAEGSRGMYLKDYEDGEKVNARKGYAYCTACTLA